MTQRKQRMDTNLMYAKRCSICCHEIEIGVFLLLVEAGDGIKERFEVGF